VSDEFKPVTLAAARDSKPDDLKLIWGVGPKLEALLHRLGFFHFDQIAAWDNMNLRWVDQNLEGFKGRARRDDWVGQAKRLATGWRPEKSGGDRPSM
jgi:NADH-quinone oxidoreductase subunit E